MNIALNIETAAIPELALELPEPEVRCGNTKDPAKIAEKTAEVRRQQITRMALDPHFGRVVATGVSFDISSRTYLNTDERAILIGLWTDVAAADQVYTFNGAAFDFPFLYRRSLLLGVRPAAIDIDKYHVRTFAAKHVDLYQLLQTWEVGNGLGNGLYPHTLAFYAKAILGKDFPYADIEQGNLAQLVATGNTDPIRQLCAWNTETTYQLAQRLRAVYP